MKTEMIPHQTVTQRRKMWTRNGMICRSPKPGVPNDGAGGRGRLGRGNAAARGGGAGRGEGEGGGLGGGQRVGGRGKGEGVPVLGMNGDLGGEGVSSKGRGEAFWLRGGGGRGSPSVWKL